MLGKEHGGPSSDALLAATGAGWDEWLQRLDAAGARDWDHKGIVAYLRNHHGDVTTGWWRQSITVGYERARGMRVVGQTADAGFQVGVQRTLAIDLDRAWRLVTSRPELWLGPGAALSFEPGQAYEVPASDSEPAATGEVRVVRPGDRLRMTWLPDGWAAPATLQVNFTERGPGRTTINFHTEKLPDAATREEMRARWKRALARIRDAA